VLVVCIYRVWVCVDMQPPMRNKEATVKCLRVNKSGRLENLKSV
jgi:hypothetical protein